MMRPDAFPHYPHIRVKITGRDGNAFAILGTVLRAMRKAGLDQSEIDAFKQEATERRLQGLVSRVHQMGPRVVTRITIIIIALLAVLERRK
jgi:hypothetical protein